MITLNYQIELRHYYYFKVLAEELHFRRAAEKLFIAQPGLTRQIKQMEAFYQTDLFFRDKKKVSLTPAGQFLKQEVDDLFNHLARVKEQMAKIAEGKMTSLQLGFIGSAVQTILPELLTDLKQKHPLVDITLNELSNETQLEMLRSEQLDFGFLRLNANLVGLESMVVFTDHFSLVVPKNHQVKRKAKVQLQDYQNEPFILFSKEYSTAYYELVMSIFHDAGFVPKVSLRTVNAMSIFNLVAQGVGIAIVPSSLKKGYSTDVDFLELDHIPQRTSLSIVWNPKNRNTGIPILLESIKSLVK